MIELELKYELKKKINLNLEPNKVSQVEDIYYDTKDYDLLRKGNFLRIRNDRQLDFKLNANDLSHLYCKETNFSLDNNNIADINEVLSNIGIDFKLETIADIRKKFQVLAPIKKKRLAYNLEENVVLVIDEVEDLNTFLEIEYDINKDNITEEEAKYYKDYLIKLLKEKNIFDLLDREVHIGYVELYLKKYNPESYHLGIYQE